MDVIIVWLISGDGGGCGMVIWVPHNLTHCLFSGMVTMEAGYLEQILIFEKGAFMCLILNAK